MNTAQRAELLIYLLVLAPHALLRDGARAGIQDWSRSALQRLATDWREEEREDVAEQFAALVARLLQSGMVATEDRRLHFRIAPEFSVPPQAIDELRTERERLLSELRRLDRQLGVHAGSNQLDWRSEAASLVTRTEPFLPAVYGSLASFLSEAGPDALDNDAVARLLTRDTGA
jgi:hypothetical protein